MLIVGLTGSIGMGKSTTAKFFAEEGIPVNDADAIVHDLYRSEAVEPLARLFPSVVVNGAVDRQELSRELSRDPDNFKRLEAIVHPLVRHREKQFLEQHRAVGTDIVLLDIPLLFESRRTGDVDSIVVVTCDPQIQRQRVLARPNMTEDKFNLILSRQTPDRQKRLGADFLIDTGQGLDVAQQRVRDIIASLKAGKISEKNDA